MVIVGLCKSASGGLMETGPRWEWVRIRRWGEGDRWCFRRDWTVRRRDIRWNLEKGMRVFWNKRARSMYQCQLGNFWLRWIRCARRRDASEREGMTLVKGSTIGPYSAEGAVEGGQAWWVCVWMEKRRGIGWDWGRLDIGSGEQGRGVWNYESYYENNDSQEAIGPWSSKNKIMIGLLKTCVSFLGLP